MARQHVLIGTVPGDGTGDKLYIGGDKINDNFIELYAAEALNTAKVTNATHTGDVTGSGALTIADTGVVAGTYAQATVTVNAKGQVTACSEVAHTGDVTGTTALTLATQAGVVANTYSQPTITVNAKGIITAISASGGSVVSKYTDTYTIPAGGGTKALTGVTTLPYSIFLIDNSGFIKSGEAYNAELNFLGGSYSVNLYSVDAIDVTIQVIF